MRTGTDRTALLTRLAHIFAVIAAFGGVITVSSTVPVMFIEPQYATFMYPGEQIADAPIDDPEAAATVAPSPEPSAKATPGKTVAPRPKFANVAVIGHRGAPAYRPQHTLEGYQLAISQGADYIEPDLVMTKDARLIARHESDLTDTTDVRAHPEFADRARDGRWHSEDLTLTEIKTLKATGGPATHSGKYQIPTLEEVAALVKRQSRRVGVYIELKAPAYFRSIDLPMEEALVAVLQANGWNSATAPVFVQSFDANSLRRLRSMSGVRLSMILWGDASASPISGAQLDDLASFAAAIVIDRDRLRPYLTSLPSADKNLIAMARSRNLSVHVFTFGYRNPYGSAPFGRYQHPSDPSSWAAVVPMYRAYYSLGVSAVLSDAPNIAVYAKG
jgi:glycerophosphoryl diester phosphodiesterase